jgi:hypothetical protein
MVDADLALAGVEAARLGVTPAPPVGAAR